MKAYEFNFYKTDESFDYGDFPNSTCYCEAQHGFEVYFDINNIVDFKTFQPCGDYATDMAEECKDLRSLRDYIKSHLDEIDKETGTPKECFEELVEFIDEQLAMRKVA